MAKIALYLAGGGARGAYQAGVLKAVNQILSTKTIPFTMVTGVSVGSINAAIVAQHADDFSLAVERLENLWQEIHCDQIFHARNYDLSKSLLRNLSHLFVKSPQTTHLLDTLPLHTFINDHINFARIKENIEENKLETMEVISHCYETQRTVSFYQHNKPTFEDWHYPRHISQRVGMNMEHILASSALPLFFPTVKIAGSHYGDGSMGLISPLRGALRFNVQKVMILGTRQSYAVAEPEKLNSRDIGFAHVLGSMLNGVFLDNLDRDIEQVNRMNEIVLLLSMWKKRSAPWRPVQTLYLRPSIDVSKVAQADYQAMPTLLRMLLNMLGAQSHSGDLLSFLLFEKKFTQDLITLGYNDTMSSANAVLDFFKD
ncbi:MAG: patatin-like phospholipase family protein [Legionellaceae bacterium]|nr:patatin-like phospholipase family protein [Legionellaceae bacterium]